MTGAERIKEALAGAAADYVTATAGDVVELFAAAGMAADPLAVHAAKVVKGGKDGADTRMMLHRDHHLAGVLAKVPGAAVGTVVPA